MSDIRNDIGTVGIAGAGTIGASWTATFLAHGLDVVVFDPNPEARAVVERMLERTWPILTEIGLKPGASRERVHFALGIADLADVDFVQESGPEREDLKIELFGQLEAAIAPDVIIASSSSGLIISRIQAHCRNPERCLIGHPFNPPHLVPLVEVVKGELTSEAAATAAIAFYAAIGKRPIRLNREVPGHVANRLQAAVLREAVHLVTTGVASLADVDQALVYGPGMRWAAMGPALTFHLGGGEGGIAHLLAHLGDAIQSWWDDLGSPDLTPEVKAALIEGIAERFADRDIAGLSIERDRFLQQLAAIQPNFYD